MQYLARLYRRIDESPTTADRVEVLVAGLVAATSKEPADRGWLLFWLAGRRRKRLLTFQQLHEAAQKHANIPPWLYNACYQTVGDRGETAALIHAQVPPPPNTPPLSVWMNDRWDNFASLTEEERALRLPDAWEELGIDAAYLWNRVICGRPLFENLTADLIAALELAFGLVPTETVEWLHTDWTPEEAAQKLHIPSRNESAAATDLGTTTNTPTGSASAYRFAPVRHPDANKPYELPEDKGWRYEWAYEGLRIQLHHASDGNKYRIARLQPIAAGQVAVFDQLLDFLPNGSLIEGILTGHKDGQNLTSEQAESELQRGKGKLTWRFQVYDVLEWAGKNLTRRPYDERKAALVQHFHQPTRPENVYYVQPHTWASPHELREVLFRIRSEMPSGIFLKHGSSPYGDPEFPWQRIAPPPTTVRAVLLYVSVQSRTEQVAELTFALRDAEGAWVPFVRIEQELEKPDWRELTLFMRDGLVEKFGPVRSLRPEWVFALAFDRLTLSKRHKSGLLVGGARIISRLRDDSPDAADSIDAVRSSWGV